jgi:adenylylsulfate kinase
MTTESQGNRIDPKVVWHEGSVSIENRSRLLGQRGCVVWFTGLSGSGKSTIANTLDRMLLKLGRPSFLLDGDNIRHGLCATPSILQPTYGAAFSERFGLGFSPEDREENIRRVGEVTCLMASAGLICLTAFVSPYRKDRDRVRRIIEKKSNLGFFEVFVNTPIDVCESRDPKGLYRQAREGKIPYFTGITDPYEAPYTPELVLVADDTLTPEHQAQKVLELLKTNNVVSDSSQENCLGSRSRP